MSHTTSIIEILTIHGDILKTWEKIRKGSQSTKSKIKEWVQNNDLVDFQIIKNLNLKFINKNLNSSLESTEQSTVEFKHVQDNNKVWFILPGPGDAIVTYCLIEKYNIESDPEKSKNIIESLKIIHEIFGVSVLQQIQLEKYAEEKGDESMKDIFKE